MAEHALCLFALSVVPARLESRDTRQQHHAVASHPQPTSHDRSIVANRCDVGGLPWRPDRNRAQELHARHDPRLAWTAFEERHGEFRIQAPLLKRAAGRPKDRAAPRAQPINLAVDDHQVVAGTNQLVEEVAQPCIVGDWRGRDARNVNIVPTRSQDHLPM